MFVSPVPATPPPLADLATLYSTPGKRPGGGAREPVVIAEKGSPLQTITPDTRRVTFSSSTGSRSARSTTPFSNLVSNYKDKAEIASLALAMSSLFDDDEDNAAAHRRVSSESPIEKSEDLTMLELSNDSPIAIGKPLALVSAPERDEVQVEPVDTIVFGGDAAVSESPRKIAATPSNEYIASSLRSLTPLGERREDSSVELQTSVAPTPDGTLAERFAALSSSSMWRYPDDSTKQLQQRIQLERELQGPDILAHVAFLTELSNQALGAHISLSDTRAQLQKFLLLPVPQLQQTVLKQHDELVKMGVFSTSDGLLDDF